MCVNDYAKQILLKDNFNSEYWKGMFVGVVRWGVCC
jgi:hypothetical protein